MTRLSGKVAIVTGGANGLGEAIATRMSEEGAAVAVLDRDEEGGERVAEKLTAAGARATFVACDVTRDEDVKSAISSVAEQFGRVDVLVNNAGVEGANKPTHELPLQEWERVMTVNTTLVFLGALFVLRHVDAVRP